MSLLDDVSIVVTPNGYKAGELYAVIPVPTYGAEEVSDGNFLLTGTQAQNTTGTYWTTGTGWTISGGNLIATSVTNQFVTQSFNFTSGKRYKASFTVTGTSSLPNNTSLRLPYDGVFENIAYVNKDSDGVYTHEFISDGSTNLYLGYGSFTGTIDNVSVKEYTSADMDVTRATAATRVDENGLVNYAEVIGGEEVPSIIGILNAGGGTITQISGNSYSSTSDGTSGSGIRPKFDFNITAGKRYKLTITPTGTISGTINFDFYDGSSYLFQNYDFTTTKEIYFIDNGSVFGAFDGAKTYDVSSFTVSVKEVTRDNVPRIDYTGGGCPHILAEPMRTNLIPYSEDFSQWSKLNGGTGVLPVLTSDDVISPDGTQNADKIVFNKGASSSNSDYSLIRLDYGGADIDGVSSIYLKSDIAVDIEISSDDINYTIINITTEWQRFTVSDATTDRLSMGLRGTDPSNDTATIYAWGAQLEEGSYATSYIPNFGTAAGVTRNQDIFTRDGIGSLINSTEGVLFVEIAALANDGTYREISLNDGTTNNVVEIRYTPLDNQFQFIMRNAGAADVAETITLSNALDFNKIAFSYKSNDYKMYVNGVPVATYTSGSMPSGLDTLSLDWGGNGTNPFFGKVKQLQVFKTALSPTQLAALTS